ncbi:hypothetical protein CANARDRAFT_28628 [[Candida] arabinofermentans NRRL YB-2248]|uniref:WIBG Mago-binding domain-containing protein n=1 Tax=[Candida] arabinofermentans NRRL YB-2248 TaxID=983967 RepID=A0A1E4SZH2_9ASCO|nr:hypothetical protein CANARDRAFT_28628 [[Candida] arabinofermentans NRRL YB-2248]
MAMSAEIRTEGGTLRSDGSVRKVVKIKPGFVRDDDVERYDVSKRRAQRQHEAKSKTDSVESRDDLSELTSKLKISDEPTRTRVAGVEKIKRLEKSDSKSSSSTKTREYDDTLHEAGEIKTAPSFKTDELKSSLEAGKIDSSPSMTSESSTTKKKSNRNKKKYSLADLDAKYGL